MLKTYESGASANGQFIATNPRWLRMMADQIENESRSLGPNQAVTKQISNNLYFYYEPSVDGNASSKPVVSIDAEANHSSP